MQNETAIMDIIVNGGDARSWCLKAVRSARNGQWRETDELLRKAEESLIKAHNVQTALIQAEVQGNNSEITLLMVHAQDHLMNAITVKDLSLELIEECRKRIELEEKMTAGIKSGEKIKGVISL